MTEARAFIEAGRWTFAKSMPEIPHEYTLRKREPARAFERFAALVKRYGYRARWGRATYTYLHVDGWKYWVIGDVINRERLPAVPVDT